MSREDWDLVRKIFDEALDVPEESRLEWLGGLDAPTGVVAEVARLLRQRERAGPDLDKSPLEVMREGRKAKNIFVAGDVVADRFLVDSFLGRGGMGEVYAVMDTESRERVALKVIAGAAVEEQEAQARLRRELLTARKVTHPNVCRVHDLARHDGMLCLTMELLDGETLAQALARGPVVVEQAREIARQIAGGLGAAHTAGVLHRDLKPSNVMLCTGRVVLMDFGLAKSVGGVYSSITASGTMLGTPDYMAPEQVEGGRATERTDIYAFGLILYEMLTGQKAFVGDTPLAAAMQRVKREAPRLGDEYPKVWRDVIARCLERDAERRFASAEEVRAALDGEIAASRRDPLLTKRRAIIFAGGVGGVSLFAGGWRLWDWKGKPVTASALVLTDITNTTGDPKFDGATLVLRNQLSQSAQFEVVSQGRVAELLARMEKPAGAKLDARMAREVALRHGAPQALVVYGQVSRLGSELMLDIKIEQPGAQPEVVRAQWDSRFKASGEQDFLARFSDAANWIRERAGEPLPAIDVQNRPPHMVTSGNWEAIGLYTMAYRRRTAGQYQDAIALLEDTLRVDAGFASAHRELADTLIAEHQYAKGYQVWMKALETVDRQRLSPRERYHWEGMFADDTRDWAKAERIYAAWAAAYPKEYQPLYYQASKLFGLGRTDEAIANFQQSLALREYKGTWARLADLALVKNDFDGARKYIGILREKGFAGHALYAEAKLHFLSGDAAKALEAFRKLSQSQENDWRGRGPYLEVCVMAETGDWAGAQRRMQEVVDRPDALARHYSRAVDLVRLAYLDWKVGKKDRVVGFVDEAVKLDPSPRVMGDAGSMLARAGFVNEARGLMGKMAGWPELPIFRIARDRVEGEVLLATGRGKDAVGVLRRAFEMAPVEEREVWFVPGMASDAELGFILSSPGTAWYAPEGKMPGILRRAVSIAIRAGRKDLLQRASKILQNSSFLAVHDNPKENL